MKATKRGETFNVIHRPRFWAMRYPDLEPETFDAIDRFADPHGTMLDVGAWIGDTTLYASRRFGRVWAMEPDPLARRYLLDHLGENGCENVTVDHRAAWTESGRRSLTARGGFLGSGESNVCGRRESTGETVDVVDLVEVIRSLNDLRLIKMDAEGAEHVLIPHIESVCRELRIALCVELHEPAGNPTSTRRELMFA